MPSRSRRNRVRRKSKYVTKRGLPFQLMKHAEIKHLTAFASDSTITSSNPIQTELTAVGDGVLDTERIGQEIQVTGVFASFTFGVGTNDPPSKAYYCRVVLWGAYSDDVAPLSLAPTELPDRKLYYTWFDKVVAAPWANTLSNSHFTMRKRFKPYMKTKYDGTGTGSATKNKLYLSIFTDNLFEEVQVSFTARMYFRDL